MDSAAAAVSVNLAPTGFVPPETPREPMEFLSRSWSLSALEVSKSPAPPQMIAGGSGSVLEELAGEAEEAATVSGNPFAFASSETSQLVMERIMSQSVGKLAIFFLCIIRHC